MRGLVLLSAFFLCFASSATSFAHPISVSDAYVEVHPDHLDVRLEVFVEDLYLFHDLKLNEQNALPLDRVAEGAKLHTKFLQERFKILTADGIALKPELQEVDDDDLPDHAIPFAHLMFFRLIYDFRYQLDAPAEHLTFLQDFTPDGAVVPSEVMVKIKPLQGRRLQNTLLPNQPWTVRLDRTDKSGESGPSESPQERAERLRKETLGITSYGQTYGFLYLEPEQTRLEVLVPLATLAGSLDVPLEPDGRLEVAEQEALRPLIETVFRDRITVQENGKAVKPKFDRVQIFGVSLTDFSQNVAPQPVGIASARVGVIMSFPAAESGQLEWNLFNEYLYQVQLAVMQGAKTERVDLRQIDGEKSFEWTTQATADAQQPATSSTAAPPALRVDVPPRTYWKEAILAVVTVVVLGLFFVPAVKRPVALLAASILLAGGYGAIVAVPAAPASLLEDQQPEQVLTPLLEKVYEAFNQRDENVVYDQLDKVVDGPMLRELYLEIRRSMSVEEQGGAIARAGNLKLLECESAAASDEGEFAENFRCRWQVEGTVEHWGHVHSRTTTYLANLTIAPRSVNEGSSWKLTNVDLLNQQQSVLETDIRKF